MRTSPNTSQQRFYWLTEHWNIWNERMMEANRLNFLHHPRWTTVTSCTVPLIRAPHMSTEKQRSSRQQPTHGTTDFSLVSRRSDYQNSLQLETEWNSCFSHKHIFLQQLFTTQRKPGLDLLRCWWCSFAFSCQSAPLWLFLIFSKRWIFISSIKKDTKLVTNTTQHTTLQQLLTAWRQHHSQFLRVCPTFIFFS